jgi:carbohydrate kinase (thermoresistant glucokinase family)
VSAPRGAPGAIIVMGPSGSGKSTLGRALADGLGRRFIEGDELHPPENIAKMRGGTPLDDVDRGPWIARVIEVVRQGSEAGIVVACSALKRRHRDQIRREAGDVAFVLPVVDRTKLVPRILSREPHYMPLSLLDSQLADFEPPTPDEGVLHVLGEMRVEQQVATVVEALVRPE